MFHDLRFDPRGARRPDFILNQAPYQDARILVSDSNFGCGSSRETAVYALEDYGVRAVIAPSFGDIFAANCIKNGILPVHLLEDAAAAIRRQLVAKPGAEITIDLDAQTVIDVENAAHLFEIGAFEKECLLEGLDDVDLTLRHLTAIETFDRDYRKNYFWLFPRT